MSDNNQLTLITDAEQSLVPTDPAPEEQAAIAAIITIKTLPEIEERIAAASAEVDEKLAFVDGLVVDEESLAAIRKIRAELTQTFDTYEKQRMAVKGAIEAPYKAMKVAYDIHIGSKFRAADAKLKAKINAVEAEIKARIRENVKRYFDEYAASIGVAEYADFDTQMEVNRQSRSMNEWKVIVRDKLNPLADGLKAIDAQPEELRLEILAEFKKLLCASKAIAAVAERHKAIAEQKAAEERRAEQTRREQEAAERVKAAAQATAPPVPLMPPIQKPPQATADDDPVMRMTFTVTARKSKLKALKAYMDAEGGYDYVAG